MPLVSIWLNTNTTLVSNTIMVYRNPVNNINHGSYITSVSKNCLTINKPCEINIPNGTTTVRLLDSVSYCYYDIAICDSNVCQPCNVGFSNSMNNKVGYLSIINLTCTCDNYIANSVVDWYGPDNSNLLAFSSGKGPLFSTEYQSTFPLSSSNTFLLPGNYVGKIKKIELNNVNFSYPASAGSVTSQSLPNCSITRTVECLTCNNGNFPFDPWYTHQYSYTASNQSQTPQPLQTLLQLNNNQKLLAYSFEGQTVPDRLTLTLQRQNSPDIILEDIQVGGNAAATNLYPETFPKRYRRTDAFKKLLTLSGLTITNNDFIKVSVLPNTAPLTNWILKFQCLTGLTFNKICLNTYKDKPYKIKTDTIFLNNPPSGCSFTISFKVSGCSTTDNAAFENSNYKQYCDSWSTDASTNNSDKLKELSWTFTKPTTYFSTSNPGYQILCVTGVAPYTFEKINTGGNYKNRYTFDSNLDLAFHYNRIKLVQNTLLNDTVNPYSTDNSNIGYYKYIRFFFVTPTAAPNPCAQENYNANYNFIHVSSEILSGQTINNKWYLDITLPIVVYNPAVITVTTCYTENIKYYVDQANGWTTGSTFNISYPYGIRNSWLYDAINSTTSTSTFTLPKESNSLQGEVGVGNSYSLGETYPASGTTPTLIPSLSAKTYNWTNDFYSSDQYNNGSIAYLQYVYRYRVVITNFPSPLIYRIEAKQISNFGSTVMDDTLNPWIQIWNSNTPGTINSTYMY